MKQQQREQIFFFSVCERHVSGMNGITGLTEKLCCNECFQEHSDGFISRRNDSSRAEEITPS